MNIVVCIKQVPASPQVQIDPETGNLMRDSAAGKMNPFDLFALECALRIKAETGAKITALTMGPPQSEKILREAYMMDVDDAILLTDRAFAGADVLATSYALSQAIESLGIVDLIICGKQTTDGDTAQVGPAISEFLNIPHIAWVGAIDTVDDSSIVVYQEPNEKQRLKISVSFPCLITVEKDIFEVRLPSYKTALKNKNKAIKVLNLAHMPDKDKNNYGLTGSATTVERIFPPDNFKEKMTLDGESADIGIELVKHLKKSKVI